MGDRQCPVAFMPSNHQDGHGASADSSSSSSSSSQSSSAKNSNTLAEAPHSGHSAGRFVASPFTMHPHSIHSHSPRAARSSIGGMISPSWGQPVGDIEPVQASAQGATTDRLVRRASADIRNLIKTDYEAVKGINRSALDSGEAGTRLALFIIVTPRSPLSIFESGHHQNGPCLTARLLYGILCPQAKKKRLRTGKVTGRPRFREPPRVRARHPRGRRMGRGVGQPNARC